MTPRSGLANRALPGWLAIPFLLLASVCTAAPERGREASLDLQGLGCRSLHVSRERSQIDAGGKFSFERHGSKSAVVLFNSPRSSHGEQMRERRRP